MSSARRKALALNPALDNSRKLYVFNSYPEENLYLTIFLINWSLNISYIDLRSVFVAVVWI